LHWALKQICLQLLLLAELLLLLLLAERLLLLGAVSVAL
jgi:hypothetical protein